MTTHRKIALNRGGIDYSAELVIDTSSIRLISEITTVQQEGRFYFHMLKEIRAELEKEGIVILVNGSRIDVYPSGMTLATEKAYIHTLGKQGSLNDLVNIFDEVTDTGKIASVEEQEVFHNKWIQSLSE